MIDNFFIEFNISYIPIDHNQNVDSLSLVATHLKYPIEVKYRPSVPDNIKQWRVFEDELEIKRFLELTGELSNSLIDQEQDDGT